jgi:DNA-directed RNA polymerase specialized sigma subunit
MNMALAILEKLKERDRAKRTIRVGRRIAGKKMTPELARRIIELHQTTEMTQQEIAFQLGVNQGRVNEVLKHGKWLQDDPNSEEAVARDRRLGPMAYL